MNCHVARRAKRPAILQEGIAPTGVRRDVMGVPPFGEDDAAVFAASIRTQKQNPSLPGREQAVGIAIFHTLIRRTAVTAN
jgi:hypothetical protein